MPIPLDKLKMNFELDEDHKTVYVFLKKNKDYAYTESELIRELNDYIFSKIKRVLASFEKQKVLELFKLKKKLDKLGSLGFIKKIKVKEIEYFHFLN